MPLTAVVLLVVFVLIFGVSLLLSIKGNDKTSGSRFTSKSGRFQAATTVFTFVGIVATLAYLALLQIRNDLEESLTDTLNTVLATTHEALQIWSEDQLMRLKIIAKDPDFRSLIFTLVDQQQAQSFLQSDALATVRSQFKDMTDTSLSQGFFIVNVQGRNLASMRDNNIGTVNPILIHRPDLFVRVLNGESVMVHAIESDVFLADHQLIKNTAISPTMFFAVPVFDKAGTVIAVLTERFNPYERFSDILRLGRVGESGETYAINEQGYFVSDSRFTDQLKARGVLGEKEGTILSFQVNDPVVSTMTLPRFTEMAQSVLQKETGINTTGYRDYRGIKVIGTWLWDDYLQLGIASEIDFDEAFLPYHRARFFILTVLGITLTAALVGTFIVFQLGWRTNQFLKQTSEQLEQRVQDRSAALLISEQRLQTVVDTIPALIYMKDLNWHYELINTEYERVLGVQRADIIGKMDLDIATETLGGMSHQIEQQVISQNKSLTVEERFIDPITGTILYYQSFKAPVVDDQNSVVGVVAVSVDVTQRKTTEKALKRTLDELSFVKYAVDHAAYMVLWADTTNGAIHYGNQAAITFFKLSKDNFEHANILDLEYESRKVSMIDIVTELRDGAKSFETTIVDQHQKARTLEVTAQLVTMGHTERIVTFARDITEFKTLEKALVDSKMRAEEGSRAKSEFLASMSHEIRTPLNGVLGMIGLVMRTGLQKEQQQRLQIAQNSATALLDIINDLLDFSKIEAHKLDIESLDFNVRDLIQSVVDSQAYRAEEKGITLSVDFSKLKQTNVKSDPTRLRQILTNLLSNAIKFTENGGVKVVPYLETNWGKTFFTCHVVDTGIGIEQDSLKFLFESFTQADSSTTRKFGGTGLGLAISKKLCKLMNGNITVSSVPGVGTEFVFFVEVENSEAAIQTLPNVTLEGMKVLIVDDNDTNRLIFRSQLEMWGVRVTETSNPLTVVQTLLSNVSEVPDVILIDLNMPEINGIQLAENIRTEAALNDLRILIMTSMTDALDNGTLARLRIDGHFSKPVTPDDLKDALSLLKSYSSTLRENNLLITSAYLQTLERPRQEKLDERLPINQQLKILLVEDNDINQLIVKGMLEGVGLSCDSVENGQMAIDYLSRRSAENPIDLVLMDCQMPILDGYQATERIRAGEAGRWAKSITIIALTAHALSGDREKCIASGMNDFLTKPLNEEEFTHLLSRYSNVKNDQKATSEMAESSQTTKAVDDLIWPENLQCLNPENPPEFAKYKSAYCAALTVFIDHAETLPTEIKEAYKVKNFQLIKERAHGLKGSSANLGFQTLSDACAELENSVNLTSNCTEQQLQQVNQWLAQCRDDAQHILAVNSDSPQNTNRNIVSIANDIVELLQQNQVVSIELVNELKQNQIDAEQAETIANIVAQLMNFEYDEALELLQKLSIKN